jgi:hypothetical protein
MAFGKKFDKNKLKQEKRKQQNPCSSVKVLPLHRCWR